MLDNEYELSKVTLNYAIGRDMFVDYFIHDSKADNEKYGHMLRIAPNDYDCTDGGMYFRIKEFSNGMFIGVFEAIYAEPEQNEKVFEYFKENEQSKFICGEKELRKVINDVYKFFM